MKYLLDTCVLLWALEGNIKRLEGFYDRIMDSRNFVFVSVASYWEIEINSEALFRDMGLTTTEAIRLFLTQCVNLGGLPFQPVGKNPNRETLAALKETGGKSYKNVEELSQLWK